ncbi:O-methyltransferase 1, chloroplastic [Euphorbia lathyris]|uniref:O-methyltransferase 1, chloroplastic n=1 Tax=Euphorbia lathyris TaxID=212925 RepID=UPI0033135648
MCSVGVVHLAPTIISRRPSIYASNARKNSWLRAKINGEADPLLQAAIKAASLRFQETHRPEPLFLDPYAGCLVDPTMQMDLKKYSHHYCLATKLIDDKLLRTVNHIDGIKQVVLLTDGMDTRPYRLNWPTSSIIFDISPERIFQQAAEKLKGVGAKIPRNCMFLHVPLESSNIQQTLHSKGFNGNHPSIWAMQGLSIVTLASFEEILCIVSSLAMNGCLFLGELPAWLAKTEIRSKSSMEKWMDKLFMSNGFRVEMLCYNEAARSLGKELAPKDYKNILFVAEQLRYSDDQMETWRREFNRVEEEGDEEGFDEL